MLNFGLKWKLAVVLGLAGLLAFAALYLGSSKIITSMLLDQEAVFLRDSANLLAAPLMERARDPAELDRALENAVGLGGFATVQVLDAQMETVAPRTCTPACVLVGRDKLEETVRAGEGVRLVRSPAAGPLFVAAVPLAGGGWLVAARSAVGFEEKRTQLLTVLIVWSGLVLVGILLAGALALSYLVVRPIRRVVQQAGAIATGERQRLIDETTSDEFGVLATSLQAMAERVQEDRRQVEEHVKELTAVNRELTQAHEQLIRTEKLASVGQLAAGIAHEIGNPIGIILGYLDVLDGEMPAEQRKAAVEQLRKATERIDGTIRDLLNFSRPAEDEQSQCEVRRDVAEVVALVRPQKRFRDVAVRFEDRVAGPARCRIPPSRLKQVLLNLLLNAADAMEGKGDLTVTLEREEGRVRLSVQDSGPGIDEKVLLKIFDPFFTTKGVGKGTGLGLYVCHTIVGRYGGEMEVDAGMGRGARFTVKLPEA